MSPFARAKPKVRPIVRKNADNVENAYDVENADDVDDVQRHRPRSAQRKAE